MSNPRHISSFTDSLRINALLPPQPIAEQKQEAVSPEYIHPILTSEDFKRTITKYQQHIKQYNLEVWILNVEIRKYNKPVIAFRKSAQLTREEKIREYIWREENKLLEPEAYNEAVEAYNNENGLQIRKKAVKQKVKPESERYFISFLHQFNMQLFNRKKFRIKLDIHLRTSLPKLEIYPNKIVSMEREGCIQLDVCTDAVRHHRVRLEEAGVLQDYSYHGPNRPVKIAFNETILSLTDNEIPPAALAGNQLVTSPQTDKVVHNNVSSRVTLLEEYKKSIDGDFGKSKSSAIPAELSTRTPRMQGAKSTDADKKNKPAARKKIQDALSKNELSTTLTQLVDHRTDFVRELAQGIHDNYQPLSSKIYQQEAYYGAMHPTDFKELAIQDVFKFSAGIFTDLEVHPGSWMNAYKIWMAEMFQNFNNQQLSKPNLLAKWMKSIEVLRQIKKYKLKHPDYTPTFPSLFFDTTRTEKHHNSFAFAYKNFKLEEEKVSSFQKRKINADKSSRHKADLEKAILKIRLVLNGKCDLQDAWNYVRRNCNKEVTANFEKIYKAEFKKSNA